MSRGKKLCLLGDFAVGKTSLVRRYIFDEFAESYQTTVGVQLHEHADVIETDDGPVQLEHIIWDIEGDRFGANLVTSYLLGSSGALVVGDVTRKDAIASMASHARKFRELLPGRPLVFVLNKCDLLASDALPSGEELADEYGCDVVQTSALTGAAVKDAFHQLSRRVLEIGA